MRIVYENNKITVVEGTKKEKFLFYLYRFIPITLTIKKRIWGISEQGTIRKAR